MKNNFTIDQQITDSKTVIKSVLNLDIHTEMKKRVIRLMIWNITGADPTTFFISEKADRDRTLKTNREHVYKIKMLIEDIINNKADLECLLQQAVICTVTEEEHKNLNNIDRSSPELNGWPRYQKANIKIAGYTIEDGKLLKNASEINAKQ